MTGRTSGRSARPAMTLKSLVSLAVEPERKVLAKALNRYPMAVQAFVQQQVLPFFGHGAAVETIEL